LPARWFPVYWYRERAYLDMTLVEIAERMRTAGLFQGSAESDTAALAINPPLERTLKLGRGTPPQLPRAERGASAALTCQLRACSPKGGPSQTLRPNRPLRHGAC
jgi:hypothetical protein